LHTQTHCMPTPWPTTPTIPALIHAPPLYCGQQLLGAVGESRGVTAGTWLSTVVLRHISSRTDDRQVQQR
jgi:hypothetical protein